MTSTFPSSQRYSLHNAQTGGRPAHDVRFGAEVFEAGRFEMQSTPGARCHEEAAMLDQETLVAFIPSRDPKKAKPFFIDVLGLRFVSEDPFAVVLESNGIVVRLANVSNVKDFKPFPFTILGWNVEDIEKTVRGLQER